MNDLIIRESTEHHPISAISTTVDMPEYSTRYEVTLTYDNGSYGISIPNLYKSIKTKNPQKIDYCLRDRKVLAGDAQAIQKIVIEILLPKLEEEMKKGRETKVLH